MVTMRAAVAALLLAAALAGCSGPGSPAAPAGSASPAAAPDAGAAVAEKINAVLAEQSAALNKGDQAGFLAPAAGNAEVEATLKKRFAGLRALGVAEVKQVVNLGPDRVGESKRWNAQIRFDYCLGGGGCGVEGPVMTSAWEETANGVKLADLDPTSYGPRPWEVDDLVVRKGKRVILATTKAHAAKLKVALPIAEQAAKVADTFAVEGSKPFRYVVYLADQEQWKTWYSNSSFGDTYAGYALPSQAEGTDLVVRLDAYPIDETGTLLRHEMTHLASISHAPRSGGDSAGWWLSEGIASVAGANGASVREYPPRDTVADYLRKTRSYRGAVTTLAPNRDDGDEEVTAKYGLGYYASRCIDDKYGRKKLLALVDAVLRNGEDTATAGQRVLGTSWTKVESSCLAYTRQAVGR
ncbi:hypothetical protein [Asanoa sp. NPDC050611]|uniref:hypothetical protein n=1 Tax=Asanoa sp. NPDC050611 TaxID=3157098 RepID=UPI0033C8E521